MSQNHSISDVSRIAGIPKDLLRMWERRYGYPNPDRDVNGDRIYPGDQLEKLILIRQLVDQGKRPGKLMGLAATQLKELLQKVEIAPDPAAFIEQLKNGNAIALRSWFETQLLTLGLRAFIHRVMVPSTRLLGDAWSRGEVEIHQEHLYTELVTGLVRQHLADHYHREGEPRVMLTTVPGEQHSLGLLMVEALLRLGGGYAVSFGTEMPFKDIREAAESHRVQVIGLSFSAGFKSEDALVMLNGLRSMIDPKVEIWAGGSSLEQLNIEAPEGVKLLNGLHALESALAEWKQDHLGELPEG